MSHGHFIRAFKEFGLVVRVAPAAQRQFRSRWLSVKAMSPPSLRRPAHPQGTFKKLYKMRTLKFGTLIGEDELGNKYYENTKVSRAGWPRSAARALGLRGRLPPPPYAVRRPAGLPAEPAPLGGVRRRKVFLRGGC